MSAQMSVPVRSTEVRMRKTKQSKKIIGQGNAWEDKDYYNGEKEKSYFLVGKKLTLWHAAEAWIVSNAEGLKSKPGAVIGRTQVTMCDIASFKNESEKRRD